jgi:16S rRNA processing protein RimM
MSNTENRLTEIARIGKVHGLEGNVRLLLQDEFEPLIEVDRLLYLQNSRGDIIPARLTDVRVEKKRNKRLFFVKFDRIADRTDAEKYQDRPVFAEAEKPDPASNQKESDIIGFIILDDSVSIGTVSGIMENPAHPIIEAELNIDRETEVFLIPWVDEYVKSVNPEKKQIICQNLDQLISH